MRSSKHIHLPVASGPLRLTPPGSLVVHHVFQRSQVGERDV